MDFKEHLGQLLGDTVGEGELRRIAMVAVAGGIKDLKLAIAEAAWQARSLAAAGRQAESARRMREVRLLRDRYRASLEEYGRLASVDSLTAAGEDVVPGERRTDAISEAQREEGEEAA